MTEVIDGKTGEVALVEQNETTALMQQKYRGVPLNSLSDLQTYAKSMEKARMLPNGCNADMAMIAINEGMQLGLNPLAAVQNIAVINNRPSLWGDSVLAIVRGSGLLKELHEDYEGEPYQDNYTAMCRAVRFHRGVKEVIESTFSVADAKKAGLWGKQGPWSQYPKRMLKYRARSFAMRDGFADVLAGMDVSEYTTADADYVRQVESESKTVSNGEAPKKGVAGLKDKMTKKSSEKSMDTEERLAFCYAEIGKRYGFNLKDSEEALKQYCQEKHQKDAGDLSVDQLRGVMLDIKSGEADPCIGDPV